MAKKRSSRRSEKRKHRRFEYPLYISYKKNGKKFQKELLKSSTSFNFKEKGEKLSVSRDISVSGICFVTREKFPSETKLLVKVWSPARPNPLIGLAEVIWQKKRSPEPGYLTGAAFASLDDMEELNKLFEIFKKMSVEAMIEK